MRTPAEWETHEAVWLAVPHLRDEWGIYFEGARREFLAFCKAIRGERLEILTATEEDTRWIRAELPEHSTTVHQQAFGDIWVRDTGPVFSFSEGRLMGTCFQFNGWGGRYRFEGDEDLSSRISELAEVPRRRIQLVIEGGALEQDGLGTLLTTRECLLNENRNPSRNEHAIESLLINSFGAKKVVWFDRGLNNDHTDGHIDNLVRFVAPGKVVCMMPMNRDDPNYDVLRDIRKRLSQTRNVEGELLEVIELPSPGRIETPCGTLLPASYCNFYIANESVIVPSYGRPTDAEAVSILAALFSDRTTLGLDATHILTGGGSFHCITQQQPRVPRRQLNLEKT